MNGTADRQTATEGNESNAYTRECLALEADTSLGSGRVTRVLERVIAERRRPENVRSDTGPEFTSGQILAWARN